MFSRGLLAEARAMPICSAIAADICKAILSVLSSMKQETQVQSRALSQ